MACERFSKGDTVSRIRWYHYYFLLALFDVVVIVFSLHMHKQTLENVSELIAAETRLDEESRWLQLVQQRILQLGAPCIELLSFEDSASQETRFRLASANLETALQALPTPGLDIGSLNTEVDRMVAEADNAFDCLAEMPRRGAGGDGYGQRLEEAGRTLTRMEKHQGLAFRALGVLAATNTAERDSLLQSHEAAVQKRALYARVFLAALIVILAGVYAFGRRLHQADRAMREERRLLAEERRERLAAIGELCSSVAHGIRNPLAAIKSSAELTLELGEMDKGSKERLTDILQEGQRLGDRVTGLLDISRENRDSFETVDLGEVVTSAVGAIRPEFVKRGVVVEQGVDGRGIYLDGDRRQLEQAVIELLSNAMEHSQEGHRVRVTCRGDHRGRSATVSVEDQGPGVAREHVPRLFDLFFTTKPSGTGIGLATVKRVAQLHGGTVELASSIAGGACFVLSLPALNGSRETDISGSM